MGWTIRFRHALIHMLFAHQKIAKLDHVDEE